MTVPHTSPWLGVLAVGTALTIGVYLVAVLETMIARGVAGARLRPGEALALPVRRGAFLAVQQRSRTERPDAAAWMLAPALYGAMAAVALAFVPFAPGWAVADLRGGIVAFGAAEALAIVAVYLHGWSANSHLPLIGAYRFVAQGLSYELLSMFVLIGAALPAQSLQIGEIVAAQADVWNAARHPPALPLWIVVTLGVAFWGPLNLPDAEDLAAGTQTEISGPHRLVWQASRAAMLVTFCAMGAACLLGGWHGPWLPGALWMLVKTVGLLAVTLTVGHLLARFRPERFVRVAWTLLLPIAFVNLAIAGIEALP